MSFPDSVDYPSFHTEKYNAFFQKNGFEIVKLFGHLGFDELYCCGDSAYEAYKGRASASSPLEYLDCVLYEHRLHPSTDSLNKAESKEKIRLNKITRQFFDPDNLWYEFHKQEYGEYPRGVVKTLWD